MTKKLNADPEATVPRHSVRDEEVEAAVESKAIGKKIRRLRLSRSMGLADLGVKTGMSASFLSQLETGRVIPTVKHLARIGSVFEKDMSYFFTNSQEKAEPFRIIRAGERIHLNLGGKGTAEMVTQSMRALVPDSRIVPCIADLSPSGEGVGFTPTVFNGLEFVYVMEGELEMCVGRETQVAKAGDAVWVDGKTTRRYRATGKVHAKSMIVSFPEM